MQSLPEDLACAGQTRTGLRRATVTGAAMAGLVAGGIGVGPRPAAADPGPPPAAHNTNGATTDSVDCQNPPDIQIAHTAPLLNNTGDSLGAVILEYSPTCRKVRAIVGMNQNVEVCKFGDNVKALIVDSQGNMTNLAVCTTPSKAITKWVNHAGTTQAAKGQQWGGSTLLSAGQTDPFYPPRRAAAPGSGGPSPGPLARAGVRPPRQPPWGWPSR